MLEKLCGNCTKLDKTSGSFQYQPGYISGVGSIGLFPSDEQIAKLEAMGKSSHTRLCSVGGEAKAGDRCEVPNEFDPIIPLDSIKTRS